MKKLPLVSFVFFLLLGACVSSSAPKVVWEPVVVWQGKESFERIKTGRPDPTDPKLQIVAVDQGGDVVLVHYDGGTPRASVIYHHPTKLTGLLVADIDPSIPGQEIYIGGYESEEKGGTVTQIVLTAQGTRARQIWVGGDYVHSIEAIDAKQKSSTRELLVSTYSGEIHVLTPAPSGKPRVMTPAKDSQLWADQLIYKQTTLPDPEAMKIKDAVFLNTTEDTPRRKFLCGFKTGKILFFDLDHPESPRVVHEEPGGFSRFLADSQGGAYATGYTGRVFHLISDGEKFRVEILDHEGENSGLRGIVMGRFPLPDGGVATMGIYGYMSLCRVLTNRLGAWDPTTIYREKEKGHAIEAADLVAGNDADELIISGYSCRLTVLVAKPQN